MTCANQLLKKYPPTDKHRDCKGGVIDSFRFEVSGIRRDISYKSKA